MVVQQWQIQPVCRSVNIRTTQWQNNVGVMLRNSLLECDDVSLLVLAVYRENTSSITEDLSKLNDREMLFLCSHYPSIKILSLMTVGHWRKCSHRMTTLQTLWNSLTTRGTVQCPGLAWYISTTTTFVVHRVLIAEQLNDSLSSPVVEEVTFFFRSRLWTPLISSQNIRVWTQSRDNDEAGSEA